MRTQFILFSSPIVLIFFLEYASFGWEWDYQITEDEMIPYLLILLVSKC